MWLAWKPTTYSYISAASCSTSTRPSIPSSTTSCPPDSGKDFAKYFIASSGLWHLSDSVWQALRLTPHRLGWWPAPAAVAADAARPPSAVLPQGPSSGPTLIIIMHQSPQSRRPFLHLHWLSSLKAAKKPIRHLRIWPRRVRKRNQKWKVPIKRNFPALLAIPSPILLHSSSSIVSTMKKTLSLLRRGKS